MISLSSNTDTDGPESSISYDNPVGIVGTGLPDSQIVLSQGDLNIGEGTSDDNGDFTITTNVLTYGDYDITAMIVLPDGTTSDASHTFAFSIVIEPPTITGFTAQPITIGYNNNGTTDDTPGIVGATVPYANVNLLLEDGSLIGSGTSDVTGAFTIITIPLSVGDHTIQEQASITQQQPEQLRRRDYTSDLSAPYDITILPPPSVVPSTGDCVLLRCYQEPIYARALTSDHTVNYNDMSVEICAAHCSSYTYFAVENSGECYCGNSVAGGTTPSSSSSCEFVCDVNPLEFCGGYGYLDRKSHIRFLLAIANNLTSIPMRSYLFFDKQ